MTRKQRVLILCTGNSCRSQMAEGWIANDLRETWEARSAGTEPAGTVHPLAVAVMAEVGVDLEGSRPESVESYLQDRWDLVVTVCDAANEQCPVFPQQVETLHISFPDPADAQGTRNEKLAVFRSVRDAIRSRLVPEVALRNTPRGSDATSAHRG